MLKQSLLICSTLAGVLFASCTHGLSLKNVSHTDSQHATNQPVATYVRFALDEPALITLNIYDGRDYLVRQIASQELAVGDHSLLWDLTDNVDKKVPDGHYHYTLIAENQNGSVTFDTTDLTGGKLISLNKLEWNRKTNNIHYSVRKPSLVNLRVGIDNGGPLLYTLLNWYPRTYGTYDLAWDGTDTSGQFDISELNDIRVSGLAYTLSSNTIIVGRSASPPVYLEDMPWGVHQRETQMVNYAGRLKLGVANLSNKRDFNIIMNMPDTGRQSKNGSMIIKGLVPVHITVEDDQLQRINNQRFEPVLFVDGKYQSEIEIGFLPITWQLDSTKFSPGEHYLAVNLRGFDGEFGVAIQKFSVEE